MKAIRKSFLLGLGAFALIWIAGCSDKGDNPTGNNNPPVLMATWSGNDGIGIFLAQKCAPCHTTQNQNGFTVTSYASIMQGGRITPGDADNSYMIQKLQPNPPAGARMPRGGPYLTMADIDTIKVWINAGAQDN